MQRGGVRRPDILLVTLMCMLVSRGAFLRALVVCREDGGLGVFGGPGPAAGGCAGIVGAGALGDEGGELGGEGEGGG